MEALRIKDISKFDSKGNSILDGINLEIDAGKTLCLIGPEKSGKTVLLECISGSSKVDRGELYYGDKLFNSPEKSEKIAEVLPPHLKQRALTIPFFRRKLFAKNVVPERIKPVTGKTGLNLQNLLNQEAGKLSKGEMRKISLARYLLTTKNVFLIDLPFIGMDLTARKDARSWLRDLLREFGITAVLVTDFPEDAFYLGDKIAIMRQGKLEQSGGREIMEKPANDFVMKFLKYTSR